MKDQNREYEGEPGARGSGFVSLSSNLSWLDDSEDPHATCDTFVASTTLVQWLPSMTMNGTPRPSLASLARCQTLSPASCVGHAGGRDTCRQTRECERAPSGEGFAAMDEAEFWGESPVAAPKPPSDAFSVKQRESHLHEQAGSVHNLIAPSQRWWEAHATGVAGVEGQQAGGSRTPSLSMLSPNSPLSPRSPSPEPDAVAGERAPGSVPSAGQECPREQVWANELLDYAQSASIIPFLALLRTFNFRVSAGTAASIHRQPCVTSPAAYPGKKWPSGGPRARKATECKTPLCTAQQTEGLTLMFLLWTLVGPGMRAYHVGWNSPGFTRFNLNLRSF